ncbi:MAG: rhombosortase [Pseudomonadota bacterium]
MWQKFFESSDWRFAALIIAFMALLQLLGAEHFRYERNWYETYELWRIVSAHWVHVGWMHWLLNSLSLMVMISLTKPQWSYKRWVVQTLALAIGISILFALFNPELLRYAGHSGVLYGLFILGAVSLFPRDRVIAILIAIAISGKVLMEQFRFHDFNTSHLIGARVVVDAHMYGMLIAIAIALIWSRYTMNH